MNREKLGNPNIDWKSVVFGFKKYRRKTIGWGKYDKNEREYEDEIYIREVSIIEGGIGCALWDASIIMTRFFHSVLELFHNSLVLELGAGCGLPSICIARKARKVYMTDYMNSLLDNLKYNVFINSNYEEEDFLESKDDPKKYEILLRKKKVKETSVVRNLNWYDVVDNKEEMYKVLDHQKFDFIFGSELTYTLSVETVDCLVETIQEFLSDDGVFMEILSTDRDGVRYFVKKAVEEGRFDLEIFNVNEKFQKGLKRITAQKEEKYKFYLMKKKGKESKMFDIFKEKLKEQEPEERNEEEEEEEGEEDVTKEKE